MIPELIVPDQTSFLYYDVRDNSLSMNDGHFHNYYEIYCLRSDTCSYFINNKFLILKPGDIMFVPPNTIHKTNYSSHVHERINLFFTEDYINPEIRDLTSNIWETNVYRPKDTTFFYNIFDKIKQVSFKKDTVSNLLLKCYMTELFCYIICIPSLHIEPDVPTKPINAVEYILNYISENYNQPIIFDEFVRWSGYTPNYLSKLFKDTTGMRYKEYLLLTRLSAAEQLLSTTNCSVGEISEKCGFNDSNYFSYIFKKKFGQSPLKFRETIK